MMDITARRNANKALNTIFENGLQLVNVLNYDSTLTKTDYCYVNQWYTSTSSYSIYYYPVKVGKIYKVTGNTYGTAKTVVLAVNTANAGGASVVDNTETTASRSINLEFTVPNGFSYIAISCPTTSISSFSILEGSGTQLSTPQSKIEGRKIIVDKNNPNSSFSSIRAAVNYVGNNYPASMEPVTIFVKNGVYVENPTVAAPYSAIPKFANKINIIGESRDGVIINCTCSATVQGKCLEIGDQCTIENLTINQLNDGTYNSGNDLGHNPYCIHNDNEPTDGGSKPYYTTVKNCKLYSECYTPVGAGLHNNQTQRYENVECIYNSTVHTEQGAMYVHGCANPASIANGVEIDNCTLISKNGAMALSLPDVVGSQQYTAIPVSIRRTIGSTTGSTLSNVSKATHDITSDSALNNVTDWNY